MRINSKILSIPPYISTSWKNIGSLHVEEDSEIGTVLVVILMDGTKVDVPHLDNQILEAIFAAHSKFMEHEPAAPSKQKKESTRSETQVFSFGFPSVGGDIAEEMPGMMQHNPDQANHPDLPEDVLNKIASIAQTIGVSDPEVLPKAEPHCNCPHCQLARAIYSGSKQEVAVATEEPVTEEDLRFRVWDIIQMSEKLFSVKNPLDTAEHYNVFLGNPVGCTCGAKDCEHIRAVLRS
jgi:hypothetical protein